MLFICVSGWDITDEVTNFQKYTHDSFYPGLLYFQFYTLAEPMTRMHEQNYFSAVKLSTLQLH